jgi:uncharacterized protein (TIGR02217 family)
MSNAVFPVLAGLGWSRIKTPQWSTRIQKAASGKEYRSALYQQPIYTFGLTYELLRADSFNELQQLVAFFNARQGSYDSFLFTDWFDNAVTLQATGVGDGSTRAFQAYRSFGGTAELVSNIAGINGLPGTTPLVYINNGTTDIPQTYTTNYTIDGNGVINFVTAPTSGYTVKWSGSYYYRCRFLKDSTDFENFMYRLWSVKKLELIGSLGLKI